MENRFHTNSTACENYEDYQLGGFHPVKLGDTFSNKRYTILRQIGYGSGATVWMAQDSQSKPYTYVALKINVARNKSVDNITEHHSHFNYSSSFINQLLDSFIHSGPNGEHACQVFELMGPSVSEMPYISPVCRPFSMRQYPLPITKRILRDTLRGLHALHSSGFSNWSFLLFESANVSGGTSLISFKVNKMFPRCRSPCTMPKDPKDTEGYPEYLFPPNPLYDYTWICSNVSPLVKLADLGFAFRMDRPSDARSGVPSLLRAPEKVFNLPLDVGIDIWAFGCLMYQLVAARVLFNVQRLEGDWFDELYDDEHLIEMHQILGPMPQSLRSRWRRANAYFDTERSLSAEPDLRETSSANSEGSHASEDELSGSDSEVESPTQSEVSSNDGPEAPLAEVLPNASLEESIKETTRDDIGHAEMVEVIRIVRKCLQYDPADRPSVSELLEEPWFHSADAM